ncbi:uncharacterized protein AB675_7066 [Cyphellophora attinorum]|uniref:Uncharacterized protein n=1 Tax=Cyphellophora attinorum TaxID=1664694 RepID=A0A0N1HDP6_9EURO|nr:uncharacterized protein AB675_7066 [Phialophora attinorum]KPI43192.1 hypothetical protein AB675_7066 [Phialophora attinorum]
MDQPASSERPKRKLEFTIKLSGTIEVLDNEDTKTVASAFLEQYSNGAHEVDSFIVYDRSRRSITETPDPRQYRNREPSSRSFKLERMVDRALKKSKTDPTVDDAVDVLKPTPFNHPTLTSLDRTSPKSINIKVDPNEVPTIGWHSARPSSQPPAQRSRGM